MNYNWNWGIFFELSPGRHRHLAATAAVRRSAGRWRPRSAPGSIALVARLGRRRACAPRRSSGWCASATPMSNSSATSRCWCRCSCGSSCCPSSCPRRSATGSSRCRHRGRRSYTAVICLGLYTSARVAEQVRAGIQSLPRGQRMAGTRDGPHAAADLSLRAAADGVPDHPAAADVGVHEHHQELLGRADHRPARAHRARRASMQEFTLPGVRGVHRARR